MGFFLVTVAGGPTLARVCVGRSEDVGFQVPPAIYIAICRYEAAKVGLTGIPCRALSTKDRSTDTQHMLTICKPVLIGRSAGCQV